MEAAAATVLPCSRTTTLSHIHALFPALHRHPSPPALALRRKSTPLPRCHSTAPQTPRPSTLGLVLDAGAPGSWEGGAVGSPVVKRYATDNGDRWLMWYHGQSSPEPSDPPGCSVGLATSPDGVRWERSPAAVMGPSTDWWAFDTAGVRPSEILIMSSDKLRLPSSVYWMYYTGLVAERGVLRALPGLAISQDGRHWARIEGEHHSGAILDGDDTADAASSPSVVVHGERDLRMYYHFPDEGRSAIGVARSRDGVQWAKAGRVEMEGDAFDESGGAMNPCVVEDGRSGGYVMAYEAVSAAGARGIRLARSADGLKGWRREGREALGKAGRGSWDDGGVGSPCLLRTGGGEWRLYYCGVRGTDGGRTGIGLAVAGADLAGFRRRELEEDATGG